MGGREGGGYNGRHSGTSLIRTQLKRNTCLVRMNPFESQGIIIIATVKVKFLLKLVFPMVHRNSY